MDRKVHTDIVQEVNEVLIVCMYLSGGRLIYIYVCTDLPISASLLQIITRTNGLGKAAQKKQLVFDSLCMYKSSILTRKK